MAWATCQSCGKAVHWRARRGCRLADIRCTCGGELRSDTAGRATNRHLKFARCVFCGRRTSFETAEAWERRTDPNQQGEAGTPVCNHHMWGLYRRGGVEEFRSKLMVEPIAKRRRVGSAGASSGQQP